MIILISPDKDIPNEIEILNQLFEEGLTYYHLRKPDKNHEQYVSYLEKIDSKHHINITTHFHHHLINDFDLGGIHFQEQKRKDELNGEHPVRDYLEVEKIVRLGFRTTSSFHSIEELTNCEINFDYHLLSPVFSSISKPGYEGKGFDVNHVDKQIIGMGGVNTGNIDEFKKLGYAGIGVLGGIWNSDTPIEDFKKMKSYYQ